MFDVQSSALLLSQNTPYLATNDRQQPKTVHKKKHFSDKQLYLWALPSLLPLGAPTVPAVPSRALCQATLGLLKLQLGGGGVSSAPTGR